MHTARNSRGRHSFDSSSVSGDGFHIFDLTTCGGGDLVTVHPSVRTGHGRFNGLFSEGGLPENVDLIALLEFNATLTIKSTPHGRAISTNYLN